MPRGNWPRPKGVSASMRRATAAVIGALVTWSIGACSLGIEQRSIDQLPSAVNSNAAASRRPSDGPSMAPEELRPLCGETADCVEGFTLKGATYATGCLGVDPARVSPATLWKGLAHGSRGYRYEEIRTIVGVDPSLMVALRGVFPRRCGPSSPWLSATVLERGRRAAGVNNATCLALLLDDRQRADWCSPQPPSQSATP